MSVPHPCGTLGLLPTTSCRPKGEGNCKPVKAGIFPPLLCLPLGGGIRAAALWQTRSHPCEPLGFTLRTLSLPHSPLFPALEVGGWGFVFSRYNLFCFRCPFVRSLKLFCCWGLGRLLKQSASFFCFAALFFVAFLFFFFTILEGEPFYTFLRRRRLLSLSKKP